MKKAKKTRYARIRILAVLHVKSGDVKKVMALEPGAYTS